MVRMSGCAGRVPAPTRTFEVCMTPPPWTCGPDGVAPGVGVENYAPALERVTSTSHQKALYRRPGAFLITNPRAAFVSNLAGRQRHHAVQAQALAPIDDPGLCLDLSR